MVAELEATSSLKTDEDGEEVVDFRLKRFLNRVPWANISSSQIVPRVICRNTLSRLERSVYLRLLRLGEADIEQRDREEQDELVHLLPKRDLSQIREELRSLKPSDAELIKFKGRTYKRDNKTIAQLKIVHHFKCQICGSTIKKRDGSFYIEAAHITPKSHKGAELPSNVLILCPNHHKEFDLGRNEIVERNDRLLRLTLNGRAHSIDLSL